ncbi:MAG: hypothetical protein IRZ08_02330 [Frankia sp.]|nr:hypothetical protein [Frankia sp.]
MLAVDIKDFSGRPGADHQRLTMAIPDILDGALRRCGLGHLVGAHRFDQSSGDGWLRGYDPTVTTFLINPFLAALQAELSDCNHRGAHGIRATHPLRMRVSIHLGPVDDSGHNLAGDGSGDARVATRRLLDAESVRDLLERSDPSATYVAAILSARVYEDAILTNYAAMPAALFHQVPVQVKTYRDFGYLYVPQVSGRLLTEGLGGTQPGGPADPPASPAPDRGDGGPNSPARPGARKDEQKKGKTRSAVPRSVRSGGVDGTISASTVIAGHNHGSITSGSHFAGPVGAQVSGGEVRDITIGDVAANRFHDSRDERDARDSAAIRDTDGMGRSHRAGQAGEETGR